MELRFTPYIAIPCEAEFAAMTKALMSIAEVPREAWFAGSKVEVETLRAAADRDAMCAPGSFSFRTFRGVPVVAVDAARPKPTRTARVIRMRPGT